MLAIGLLIIIMLTIAITIMMMTTMMVMIMMIMSLRECPDYDCYTLPLIELIGLSAATHCMGFRTTDFRGGGGAGGVEGENRRKDE